MNEVAMLFKKLNINTNQVLNAAKTKWNFLDFKPGLVGGHCIGVDPYYLAHKAESLGYHPQVILSGRRVNDNMGMFVANKLIKLLISKNHVISKSKVLVLGITFKEDCPDIRNSKVIDIVKELQQFSISVDVFDPHADKHEVKEEYGLSLVDSIENTYDGIVLAVSHQEFLGLEFEKLKSSSSTVIFDTKSFLDRSLIDARL
jgi:UDP-N-acetyl-D-galactosamine dehydrogenase